MTLAAQVATDIAARYGRDPWDVAAGIGLPVFEERLPSACDEVYVADPEFAVQALIVSRAKSGTEARELVAHGIAHHLLHAGNRLVRDPRVHWTSRHEREADDFAAYLLVGEEELRESGSAMDGPTEFELAEHFSVTTDLIRRRLELLRLEEERLALDRVSID